MRGTFSRSPLQKPSAFALAISWACHSAVFAILARDCSEHVKHRVDRLEHLHRERSTALQAGTRRWQVESHDLNYLARTSAVPNQDVAENAVGCYDARSMNRICTRSKAMRRSMQAAISRDRPRLLRYLPKANVPGDALTQLRTSPRMSTRKIWESAYYGPPSQINFHRSACRQERRMTLSVCLKRAQASVATLPVQIPRDRCTGNLAARQHAVALADHPHRHGLPPLAEMKALRNEAREQRLFRNYGIQKRSENHRNRLRWQATPQSAIRSPV